MLDALLQAHAAHNRTDHDRHHHPRDKPHRVGEHVREHGRCHLRIRPVKHARRHLRHIGKHPAAHGGVKHHEHRAADVAPPGEPVPRARRLQPIERLRGRLLRCAPNRKLHHHDRQPQNHEEYQVDEEKCSATVLPCNIGETPHVPQPYCAPGADEDKPQTRCEMLARRRRRGCGGRALLWHTTLFPIFPDAPHARQPLIVAQ